MQVRGHGWQAAAVAAASHLVKLPVEFTSAEALTVVLPNGTAVPFEDAISFLAGTIQPAEDAATVSLYIPYRGVSLHRNQSHL